MKHLNRAAEKHKIESINVPGHMDIVMIHAVLESLFTIFSTMVKLDIQPGEPVPKQDTASRGVVTALIGMNSDEACGSVALSLTVPTIRAISSNLLGHEIAAANNEAMDLAGELTNMLTGNAKRILSEKGINFDMQRPQMKVGEGHQIVHHFAGQTVLLPVKLENQHEFYVELNFV